jgi:hypothetical protein
MSCCESISLQDADPAQVMQKAKLNEFNGDVSNIVYCLKAFEVIGGPGSADHLKNRLIQAITNLEVPNWQ